jgi:hypothetical protein
LCIHDARNFDEYTQVLAGDITNKMGFLGGEEGASLRNFVNVFSLIFSDPIRSFIHPE